MQNGASKKNKNEGATLLAISDYANEKVIVPFFPLAGSRRAASSTLYPTGSFPASLYSVRRPVAVPGCARTEEGRQGGQRIASMREKSFPVSVSCIRELRGRLLRPPERVQEFARMQSAGAIGNVRCFLLSFLCFFFSSLLTCSCCVPRVNRFTFLPRSSVAGDEGEESAPIIIVISLRTLVRSLLKSRSTFRGRGVRKGSRGALVFCSVSYVLSHLPLSLSLVWRSYSRSRSS